MRDDRRRAAGEPGDARRADRARGAPIPGRIPVRPARGRAAALAVAAAAQPRDPAAPCRTRGTQVRRGLAARRIAAGGLHARTRRRRRGAPARGPRRARDALRRARAGRCARDVARGRPSSRPRPAAVSAVLDDHHREHRRRAGAGARRRCPHAARLPPRRAVGRGHRRFDPRALGPARARRTPAAVAPWPAAARRGQRRSVRAAVRGQRAGHRHRARPRAGRMDAGLPVAFRGGEVAAARHRRHPRRARGARRASRRCRLSRLRRRLPRDARGDRDDAGGSVRRARRRAARHPLPQCVAPPPRPDCGPRRTRAGGGGVRATSRDALRQTRGPRA